MIALALALAAPTWTDPHQLVDAVAWAASERELTSLLRDARAADGPLAPSLQEAARRGRPRGLPLMAAEVELLEDDRRKLVHVRQGIVWTHRGRGRVETVTLRLLGNGEQRFPESARVLDARVDRQAVGWSLQGTLLTLELPRPLRRGDRARILLDLVEDLPPFDPEVSPRALERLTSEDVGSHGFAPGAVHLSGALAMPVAELPGGPDRRPLPTNGEHAVFDPINVHLVVDVPDTWQVVTTGVDLRTATSAGRRNVVAVAADTREVMVALGADLVVREYAVGGLRLKVHADDGEGWVARQIARWGTAALETLHEAWGPLDIAELDIVEAPLQVASGAEFPGLVLVDATPGGEIPDEEALGATVAHEVAHQWWSARVGTDGRDEPWLDEGLASLGAARVTEGVRQRPSPGWRSVERAEADAVDALVGAGRENLPAALPGEAYDLWQYSSIVYGRSLHFLQRVQSELGTERFDAALRRFAQEHRGGRATGDDLVRALRREADRPDDIDALYRRWILDPWSAQATDQPVTPPP